MKKLIHLWCLLCLVVSLSAQNSAKTYTVSVRKLTTSIENVLIEPIPEFNIPGYQNVASNGRYQLNIEFTKGLITQQLITRKDVDKTFYQKVYYDSPAYTLKITDLKGNLLFENNYGGIRENSDWGKSQKFANSDAAYQVWRTMREKVWKELELKSIDLAKMRADVMTFFDGLTSTKKTDSKTPKPNEQKQLTVIAKKKTTSKKADSNSPKPNEQKQSTVITKKKTTPSVKTRTDELLIKLVGSGVY